MSIQDSRTYVQDNMTIHNADCMTIMAGYEDNYFDLAVVDPPYGINENGSTNHSRGKCAVAKVYESFAGGDKEPPSKEYFIELRRVSKNQIIWGANHFSQNIMRGSSCWIIWDKENGTSDFADCELAYTSFKTAVRLFRYRWAGMLQGDMKNKEVRIHGTQKPVRLYSWIFANYAKEGQKILDTHGGSFSSAIAAHYAKMGEFVGCELSDHYYKASIERIRKETRQQEFNF